MDREKLAEALVEVAKIPLVFYESNGRVFAVNKKGRFDPEESAREILGEDHPLVERTAEDLVRVCRHPDAGDLVVSGWSADQRPLTFAEENGAHGGPGKEETSGVLLIPKSMSSSGDVFRPLNLRGSVLRVLDQRSGEKTGNIDNGVR